MSHDPEQYADPMEFKPSRFIAKDGKEAEQDPARIASDTGAGKLLADTIVFLACSAVLSVFNISKPRENGDCVGAPIGHPLPLKCVVEPRDVRSSALIRSG
ncbi:hypothetical protein B0H14DRAFT_2824410 [Mycena olivaceomarginata]|nr:hypothetical protein B0H14DRAFT_2824410 [Mycena olivaceomarginata]